MKKVFLILLSFFLTDLSISADEIKLVPKVIQLGDRKRSPINIPSVYLDGNTLTFDASCIGGTISLEQDGVVVYTATISENEDWEGEVVLPDYLVGTYTLHLQIGAITFVGEIEM